MRKKGGERYVPVMHHFPRFPSSPLLLTLPPSPQFPSQLTYPRRRYTPSLSVPSSFPPIFTQLPFLTVSFRFNLFQPLSIFSSPHVYLCPFLLIFSSLLQILKCPLFYHCLFSFPSLSNLSFPFNFIHQSLLNRTLIPSPIIVFLSSVSVFPPLYPNTSLFSPPVPFNTAALITLQKCDKFEHLTTRTTYKKGHQHLRILFL